MFVESVADVLPENAMVVADLGYIGTEKKFPNALIPHKATKNRPLTAEQKAYNKMVSKIRVAIEHVNRELKIFRICKETYRGKGERGLIRTRVIAGLYNKMKAL